MLNKSVFCELKYAHYEELQRRLDSWKKLREWIFLAKKIQRTHKDAQLAPLLGVTEFVVEILLFASSVTLADEETHVSISVLLLLSAYSSWNMQ